MAYKNYREFYSHLNRTEKLEEMLALIGNYKKFYKNLPEMEKKRFQEEQYQLEKELRGNGQQIYTT